MSDARLFGPGVPPTSWPLQGVPSPVLEAIRAFAMAFDMAEASEQPLRKGYYPFPDIPEFRPFGPCTRSLSLVCKSFRDIITARGIFNYVEFKTPKSVHLINKKLGSEARAHVT